MLMLSRTEGKAIIIGDDIRITVTKVKRNQVYLGIEAPLEVAVHRLEIYDRIQDERNGESDVELEIDDDNYDFDDEL